MIKIDEVAEISYALVDSPMFTNEYIETDLLVILIEHHSYKYSKSSESNIMCISIIMIPKRRYNYTECIIFIITSAIIVSV